jgi:hypothetical protein
MVCLDRLLREVRFNTGEAQVFSQKLLDIGEGEPTIGKMFNSDSLDHPHENINELQQRALYLAAAIERELRKYQPRHSRIEYKSFTDIPPRKFNLLLRNALYTALYAAATYEESVASRRYVETTKREMPVKYRQADLSLGPAKKDA